MKREARHKTVIQNVVVERNIPLSYSHTEGVDILVHLVQQRDALQENAKLFPSEMKIFQERKQKENVSVLISPLILVQSSTFTQDVLYPELKQYNKVYT